mgnify:CR=1 FL=1
MNIGTLRVSRWVLIFEMIMCFWWLTWMFGALASRGVYGFAGPLPMDAWFFQMLLATIGGPIGLIVAFKSIVLGRPVLGPVTLAVLCVPVAWTVIAYGAEFVTRGHGVLDALGLIILFALLPALGVAHLVYLSWSGSRKAVPA